ncbi:hypothetical protein KDA_62130 [Dictyobacter alpinus]|uniref:Zinc-ribbon domain-containing protein n=1 Tax=Dictyobacter alpinus TaxID=2014873 RepID=A0A402BHC5_9CHLR|nr:hypothetical protein [Dictyobacter alpinus]GCE30729.1 hypothetical protein KDA_62130 [Dictyobacter alpinus]
MQCRVCGARVPAGANACPSCGTIVQTPGTNPQGQLPPTAYAGPTTATNYGNAPVPPPPSYPGNSYQNPTPAGSSPYQPIYPTDPYQQPGQQYPSSTPYNNPPGGPSYPGGPNTPFQAPRKKSRTGLIVAIVAVVLVLGCIGSVFAANKWAGGTADNGTATPTTAATTPTASPSSNVTPTPATTNTQPGATPSGTPIDPVASKIIIHPQTAGDVDKKAYTPIESTIGTTFKVNKPIYVTFNLDPNKYNVAQTPAWVNVRFYRGSDKILKDDPLKVDDGVTVGYFGVQYYLPTPDAAAEIYWCNTQNCSDGKLAQVVHFTVTE